MSAPPSNRFERRRAETRGALIRAARQILAETGDTGASIQAIAERADVGFGSFYNHFDSKTELFEAAVVDALEEFGQNFDQHLTGIDDPAAMVEWRWGMAHLAPFVASLDEATRERMRVRAEQAAAGLPPVVVPMLALSAS